MGNFNKFADCFFIECVQICFSVEPGSPFIVFPVEPEQLFPCAQFAALRFGNPAVIRNRSGCRIGFRRKPGKCIFRKFHLLEICCRFAVETFHFVTVVSGDFAARRAGRPAVFVIQPRIHAQFFRFRHAGANAFKPFIAKIFRVQPDSGVHEKTAEAHSFQMPELTEQFRYFKFGIPRPERSSAELDPGRTEFL